MKKTNRNNIQVKRKLDDHKHNGNDKESKHKLEASTKKMSSTKIFEGFYTR